MTPRPRWQLPESGISADDQTRFWSKVNRNEAVGACWLWTGSLMDKKPVFSLHGQNVAPSRIAWALTKGGLIPKRLERVESCTEVVCVNPEHRQGLIPVLITSMSSEGGIKGVVVDPYEGTEFEAEMAKADRTTWTCSNGRTCDHCGHSLTAHADQMYCPAEKRWKCPCGEAFAEVRQFDEHRSTCNEPYPVKVQRMEREPEEEYVPPSASRMCSDCEAEFHEKDNWSTEPGVDRCKHCEQVRMGLIKDHSKWCTCGECIVKRDRARSGQAIVRRPTGKRPELAAPYGAESQHPGDGYRTLDAYASLQFGFTPNPRHHKPRVAAEEPVQTPEGPQVIPLSVGTVEHVPRIGEREKYQPISVEELAAIIFAPNTVVVTYPSGAVHISCGGARVVAPDAEAAVQYILKANGQRRVVG